MNEYEKMISGELYDYSSPETAGSWFSCRERLRRFNAAMPYGEEYREALRELIPAGLVAILATLVVGFIGGPSAIAGFLLGNIVSGLLLALFMSNSGGLWDNSKKYVESGNEGGKGSDAHKAAVIGDTVGDPYKDTAGPSINTQITVVSLVSSLCSTLFVTFSLFA